MKIQLTLLFAFWMFAASGQLNAYFADTTKTTTDLSAFRLSRKVLIAEYGKVRMFFNQQDYLSRASLKDTVILTPKYFDDAKIADLLISGKAQVIARSDGQKQKSIVHYSHFVGSMIYKEFELENGTHFFSYFEGTRYVNWFKGLTFDSLETSESGKKKRCPVTTKDFEYAEEFPDPSDKKPVKLRDYFPSIPGQHLVFKNNNGYNESDIIVCKSALTTDNEIFYFAEVSSSKELVSIGSTMFGNGVYYYRNDSLFVKEVSYEEDLFQSETDDEFGERMGEEQFLLPPVLIPGDSVVMEDSWSTKSYVYLGNETLEIDDETYPDCIKFKIFSHSESALYISYIWLQKQQGLVKWMRPTGRVDELINRY